MMRAPVVENASGGKTGALPTVSADEGGNYADGSGIRAYDWAGIVRLSYSASAADSNTLTAGEYALNASTRCYVLVSVAGTDPTASTGFPLPADVAFHVRLSVDAKISVVRDTADGFLHIMPVA